ncbi:MAG: glycosyltransferase [Candidatus Binatia bacterium]
MAYVCSDPDQPLCGPRGSSVRMSRFLRALVDHGLDVTVFAARAPETGGAGLPCPVVDISADGSLQELRARTAKYLRACGYPPARAEELYGVLLNQALMEGLENHAGGCDLVYERYAPGSYAGLLFARRSGLPYFVELDRPLPPGQRKRGRLDPLESAGVLGGTALFAADAVTVASPALFDCAMAYGVPRYRIKLLPYAVSDAVLGTPKRPARAEGDEFVLGYLGELAQEKGLNLLLRAFALLRERSSHYRLLMVGDGPMRETAEASCRARGLGEVVTFTGRIDHDQVPAQLLRMDVGLSLCPPLSCSDEVPAKVWEYAAARVPIVASAGGSSELRDVFPHKKAALLHLPGRFLKIVKHVDRLRRDPEFACRLTRHSRLTAKTQTWGRVAARVEGLYQKCLSSKSYG